MNTIREHNSDQHRKNRSQCVATLLKCYKMTTFILGISLRILVFNQWPTTLIKRMSWASPLGIAKMPVPISAFNRWISVTQFLKAIIFLAKVITHSVHRLIYWMDNLTMWDVTRAVSDANVDHSHHHHRVHHSWIHFGLWSYFWKK